MHTDNFSLKIFTANVLCYIGTEITKSDALFWLTVAGGITTLAYNCIKIYKALKK